ncbi:MAG: hypothetical protein ABH864_02435 [archaeon]
MKKPQNHKRQFFSNMIILFIVAILLVGTIIVYVKSLKKPIETFEDLAESFCDVPNVVSVSICNGQIIGVQSSLLGGGIEHHHRDGTTFTCPVIAPDSMSANCKAIFNAQQNEEWNCIEVC